MRHNKIIGLIISLLILVSCSASASGSWQGKGAMYLEINKQTNGSFVWKMPAIEGCFEKDNFFFEPEMAMLFTSRRADMLIPNHHSLDMNMNFGINLPFWEGSFLSFSQGMRKIFEDNDDGLPEDIEFYNTMRCGVEF